MPKYDRPITIERYEGGTEVSYNQEDRTKDGNWCEMWSGFCREVARGSSEFFRTARLDSRIERVFRTRWNPEINDIDPREHRVRFEDKVFYMTGTPEDEESKDREISISCTHWVEAEV